MQKPPYVKLFKCDMNLTPKTYKKAFCLKARWFDLQCGFISFFDILPEVWNYLNRFALIQKNYRKHEKWKKENLVYYQVNCGVFTNLIRLKSHTKLSSDQNIQKHEENLGSKLTNHEMKKFPERSEVWLFSLREDLCFYFDVIGSCRKRKKIDILCSQ